MKFNKLITAKGIIFLLIFTILVFIGDRINFSKLVGAENQFFTLFQFFGPVAGAFLGPVVGVLSVLIAEVSSYLLLGKAFTLINVLRLLPMLFAAWYFGTKPTKIKDFWVDEREHARSRMQLTKNPKDFLVKDKLSFLVPLVAIALFVAHPVGMQAWFFSLFWTIPIIIKLLPKRYGDRVFLRSLGATFTAHAVGGAMWNYIVPMTPQAWAALIPVVIYERLLFAGGITISFIALNTLLDRLDTKIKAEYINIDKRYVLFRHDA